MQKPITQRQLKVAETIRHSLSQMFIRGDFYLKDGKTLPQISVTEVQISPDLKNATAFIMPLAGQAQQETIEILHQQAPQIRHYLSNNIELRYTPKLHFKIDEVIEKADHIDQLFHKLAKEDKEA